MQLVEQHIYKKADKEYKELDNLCFLSKNLYNSTLYAVRQYYFKNKKYLNYEEVNKLFQQSHNVDYFALPSKVSQHVQKLVNNDFVSFFKHLKVKKHNEVVNIPRYLHKTKGRQVLFYTNQAFSKPNSRNDLEPNTIKLSKTNVIIKPNINVNDVKFVRVVPNTTRKTITVEVGYEAKCKPRINTNNIASIDLGVSNLAALTFTNNKPIIINGRPIKSINRYYNKEIGKLQAIAKTVNNSEYRTNRMTKIILKRNNRIKNYLHKATRYIVNQLVENKISTLIVGYNKGWKQDTNLKAKNNQNFVQIPFLNFVNMLIYKCWLEGIKVELQEESHTSKCSFLDREYVGHHNKYLGKRIKRGLFRTSNKTLINADVNASYNIMCKYIQSAQEDENVFENIKNIDVYSIVNSIEACSTPLIITPKYN